MIGLSAIKGRVTTLGTFVLLMALLTACGSKGNAGKSSTLDPLVEARQSYTNTIQNLQGSRQQLSTTCEKAEEKLSSLTADDVADENVLSNLRESLNHAKTFVTENADESNSTVDTNATIDEIERQKQVVLSKIDEINKERSELEGYISQVVSSVNTRENQYENMSMYDLARAMGYEVEELVYDRYHDKYTLCFSYGENASFEVFPLPQLGEGFDDTYYDDIVFFGKKRTQQNKNEWFPLQFYSTSFGDEGHISRDKDGHWIFTGAQKKRLCRLLSGFKNSGPNSFMNDLIALDENRLTDEMKSLAETAGLKFAYKKVYKNQYMIMTSNGDKVASFYAVYSNADFRTSEEASELGTYSDGKYRTPGSLSPITTQRKYHYPTDYINGSGNLISDHGRVVELGEFFGVYVDSIGSSEETNKNEQSDHAVQSENQQSTTYNSTTNLNSANGFVLPNSDKSYISKADLDKLSKWEVRVARNEIMARHGRRFNDQQLQDYFNGCDWYHGTMSAQDFDKSYEGILNEYEKKNAKLITEYEKEKGYN